ncbi:MAG: hypothetical protein ACD_62C00035G0010 [uncultured bacterium]|nr:MAG: hypothetical protein ACD_62C00035G0010 [uncultured bacterium]
MMEFPLRLVGAMPTQVRTALVDNIITAGSASGIPWIAAGSGYDRSVQPPAIPTEHTPTRISSILTRTENFVGWHHKKIAVASAAGLLVSGGAAYLSASLPTDSLVMPISLISGGLSLIGAGVVGANTLLRSAPALMQTIEQALLIEAIIASPVRGYTVDQRIATTIAGRSDAEQIRTALVEIYFTSTQPQQQEKIRAYAKDCDFALFDKLVERLLGNHSFGQNNDENTFVTDYFRMLFCQCRSGNTLYPLYFPDHDQYRKARLANTEIIFSGTTYSFADHMIEELCQQGLIPREELLYQILLWKILLAPADADEEVTRNKARIEAQGWKNRMKDDIQSFFSEKIKQKLNTVQREKRNIKQVVQECLTMREHMKRILGDSAQCRIYLDHTTINNKILGSLLDSGDVELIKILYDALSILQLNNAALEYVCNPEVLKQARTEPEIMNKWWTAMKMLLIGQYPSCPHDPISRSKGEISTILTLVNKTPSEIEMLKRIGL